MTDALSKLRDLPEKLRKKAIASREEAGRIRRTVHIATDAESNCQVRAEALDDVAAELEALLPALEQHLSAEYQKGFTDGITKQNANYRAIAESEFELRSKVAALEQRERGIESTTIMRFRKMPNRTGIHGYYNEMMQEFGDEQPLREREGFERDRADALEQREREFRADELAELLRRTQTDDLGKLWSYGVIVEHLMKRIQELRAALNPEVKL